jgi:hypothetical protein
MKTKFNFFVCATIVAQSSQTLTLFGTTSDGLTANIGMQGMAAH